MKEQKIMSGLIILVCLFAVHFLQAQEPPEGFQELYQEYMMINQELQTVHQLAMQDPDVVKGSDEFSDFIDNKLKMKGTEIAEMVDERNEIITGIEVARAENDQDAETELQPRYQQISQQLQPHIAEVLENEEVQERQIHLENLLMEKMIEIDPETETKIERLEELQEELQKMME